MKARQEHEQSTGRAFVRIDLRRLSAFDQMVWIVYCAGLCKAAGVTHLLEVSDTGLAAECREILESGFLQTLFPDTAFVVSASPGEPDPAQSFVCVSGSEVLTSQLLARFDRVFVRASRPPGGADFSLYMQELAENSVFAALSGLVKDGLLPQHDLQALRHRFTPSSRKATLMTSIFRGDKFLDGFLENISKLSDYAEHEHFLVRAASPGNEHAALMAYVEAQPSAVYVNLAEDPGLYDVWNLVLCLASGQYVSSANLDDRRSPSHVLKLAHVLGSQREADVASSALRVTHSPNMKWESPGPCKLWYASEAHPKGEYAWQELFRTTPDGKTASRNMPHCMPLWRRTMHGSHGMFRESEFGPSADWEFWLRSGIRGASFYLLPEPLGLYLKSPDSYWNVAAKGEDFDAKIIEIYEPRPGEAVPPRDDKSSFSSFPELTKFGRWNGRLLYFHRTVQLASETSHDHSPDELESINAHALAQFGIDGFSAVAMRAGRKRGFVSAREAFDCAVRWLAGQRNGDLDERQLRNWWLLFADYGAMTGCRDEAMLARARLHWIRDEQAAAWRLMKDAWKYKGERFWPVFQSLFRFELPLAEVTERLAALDIMVPPRVENASSINLWYYPDFRNNAYQASLYEPLRVGGATVHAIDRNARVDIDPEDSSATNILHIHWIHTIFTRIKGQQPAEASREFLAEIKRAKERGVRVLWTVHNYLSHQGKHREVELALRRDLARLVDDVYLHHPMIREELDWLPEDVVPKLMEHGSYALADNWKEQRQQARAKLGLPENVKVVACAGQLRPYKQLEVYLPQLLEWVSRTPDAHLLVLGQIGSTEVREILSSANSERVLVVDRFLPEDELDEYLCAADFGFLSYAAILTSGTLFHMLSRALPVIAPSKGTIPAYVVDRWNGYLYENIDMINAALDELNRLDEKAIGQLRENALSVARKLRWEFRLDPDNSARQREAEQTKRADELQKKNADLAAQLERAQMAERSSTEDRDALLEYTTELETRYRRVLKSRTWKLMAPVRFMGRWLRALLTGRKPARNSFPKRPRLRGRP